MKQNNVLTFIAALVLGATGGYFIPRACHPLTPTKKIVTYRDTIVKPRVLFHGSSNKNIKLFEPRAIRTRDKKEGSVIFATPHIGLAAKFMLHWNDSWVKSGSFSHRHYHFICADRKRFTKEDRGGAIYMLPSDDFTSDLSRGLGAGEWVTRKPVKPLYKIKFDSCLEAMLQFGVQVYFVDKETLKQIIIAPDGGRSIVKTLVSENQKRGINPLPVM